MGYKPTICLDFDGVIHCYDTPWINAQTIPDPPVPGAFKFIESLWANGFRVAIHSSRSHQVDAVGAMRTWMAGHLMMAGKTGEEAAAFVDNIEWAYHKPAAFLTIDDRVLRFDGVWPNPEDLRSFKPWNKLT
jgi:hypothetical protein